MENKTITVWFSCGAASAVAAKKTLEKYGKTNNVQIVNNPVLEEHEDNRRFLKDVAEYLQHPILEAKNKNYPNASIVEVFDKRNYISGVDGAPCTKILKMEQEKKTQTFISELTPLLGICCYSQGFLLNQ